MHCWSCGCRSDCSVAQDDLHHMLAEMCRKGRQSDPEDQNAARILMLRQQLAQLCDKRLGKNLYAPAEPPARAYGMVGGKPTQAQVRATVPEINNRGELLSRSRKRRAAGLKDFSALYGQVPSHAVMLPVHSQAAMVQSDAPTN